METGTCQSLFPYGDLHMEMRSHFILSRYGNEDSPFPYGDMSFSISMWGSPYVIPIWKRSVSISIWGCVNLRFHMEIPVWKWGAISYDSPYRNRHSPFPYGDVSIPISIWLSLYGNGEPFLMIPHMETGIPHFHIGKC